MKIQADVGQGPSLHDLGPFVAKVTGVSMINSEVPSISFTRLQKVTGGENPCAWQGVGRALGAVTSGLVAQVVSVCSTKRVP